MTPELKSHLGRLLESGTPQACVDKVAALMKANPEVRTVNVSRRQGGILWEVSGGLKLQVSPEGRVESVASREGWSVVEIRL